MASPHKLFYKGTDSDFVVFIEDPEVLAKYKAGDTTLPLIDVVSIYKIFVNRQGGVEGVLDEASKEEIQNEFGNKANVDSAIKIILEKGEDKQGAGRFASPSLN
ncbi:hypothetical protein OXX80_003220 [Metschnikowia pulcherrima]|uniref:Shwachman-Bodian-Diamond syndrome (SBDS) protein n=2 Tax=Metschnikowia TaxID=27320 RepID=A0A4V1AEF4_9ASCO|nr:hypothetical protein HF325_001924 [Metschnikowia pulcherrima]QBM89023.1 Shwachman-Bodian-Diamond syndrome (SBDS) protein [Metschnikowia aff. pulcherrima]